eukprot:CAMPEP_0172038256 /NCGR_PEP_ID=MMETSP1041-20130122/23212_1 /TAXON_ID=464988 /ORGANISM="Hemiselmis andersenii, Strain CCMP439" /LENGTH=51 /DNA_ID=CAMNT_0012695763 /DNA_START=32 /DNA_END=184 /DNA_ORIENTATION=+
MASVDRRRREAPRRHRAAARHWVLGEDCSRDEDTSHSQTAAGQMGRQAQRQ